MTVQPRSEGNVIGGVGFINVSELRIQTITASSSSPFTSFTFGIVISEATSVKVHSVGASNCSVGFLLYHSTNTNLSDMTAMNNRWGGVLLEDSTNTTITNTTAMHNGGHNYGIVYYGVYLEDSTNTTITNTTAMHNGGNGVVLTVSTNTTITNTIVMHSGLCGVLLDGSNIIITNTIVMHNGMNNSGDGMCLCGSTNTTITNTIAMHNGWDGVNLFGCTNTTITNTTAMHNVRYGMIVLSTNDTTITNTTVTDGIFLESCQRTTFAHLSTTKGLTIYQCTDNDPQQFSLRYKHHNYKYSYRHCQSSCSDCALLLSKSIFK